MGAILFKIEASNRQGFKPGCTDKACAWNNDFKDNIKGEKIRNIRIYKRIIPDPAIPPVGTDSADKLARETEQREFLQELDR